MKKRILLKVIQYLLSLFILPFNGQSQGIEISSGANITFTGSATVEIFNGGLINNGSITKSNETIKFSGSTASVISGSSNINMYNLLLTNTGGITTQLALLNANDLIIAPGSKFAIDPDKAVVIGNTLTNNAGSAGFVLHSDSSGTASLIHTTDNVPATVERYISGAAEAWHFLSSPVVNQGISGNWLPAGTYGNGTGYDLYLWNESNNCWIYKLNTTSSVNWNTVHTGSNFSPGRGYLYSVQEVNPLKSFVGNLTTGFLVIPLTASSIDPILRGFNLVGNPYASSMDWQSISGWTRSDLVSSGGGYDMWIWNPAANNYGVFNSATGVGTNSVTRYIAPMQGFFVKASVAGNLVVDNNVRVSDAAGWFKSTDSNSAGISLVVQSETDNSSDEALLLFGYSANEPGAVKLFSHVQTAPSLYLSSGNEKYSVQYLTDTVDYPTVPVLFKPGKDGNYTLSCNFDNDNFNSVTLEDRQMHYSQDMKSVKSYNFMAALTDSEDRFVLQFGPQNNPITGELPARIFTDGFNLIADMKLVKKDTYVLIYDVTGRKLTQFELKPGMQHTLSLNSARQVLIISMRNADGAFVRKLLWAGNQR